MSVDAKHPAYTAMLPRWIQMRDSYEGEHAIKDKGQTYLPAAASQLMDWKQQVDGQTKGKGELAYIAYVTRAHFPDFVKEAVKAMVGVMHRKPAVIELPPALEPLRISATSYGEGLNLLLRRINEAQLTTGRIGLLGDLSDAPSAVPRPYIATYDAETVVNWDDGTRDNPERQTLNLVVLCETEPERQSDFSWEDVIKYRVLVLGATDTNEATGVYRQGVFRGERAEFNEAALMEPKARGTLDEIPFVFVNATDLLAEPMMPPLIGLSNLCLTIYRGEADYRLGLFQQSQDTLVVAGASDDEDIRIGAGAVIYVESGGSAEFIGANSNGIPEQRAALENDRRRAGEVGAQLLSTTSRESESGEALKVRVAAQTTTLNQVALAGAAGLEAILKVLARWLGADPAAVKVQPNLDFADSSLTPADYVNIMSAKEKGLPLAEEDIHARLARDEWTADTYAQTVGKLAAEQERKQAAEPEPEPAPMPNG